MSATATLPATPPVAFPAVPSEASPLLSAAPPAAPEGGGFSVVAMQILLFIAIFYFILIRPQRKERQRHQEMLKKLGKGDQVMTNGGILGQIVHATEHELTVRTAESTRLVVDRGHVARKIEEPAEADDGQAGEGKDAKDARAARAAGGRRKPRGGGLAGRGGGGLSGRGRG